MSALVTPEFYAYANTTVAVAGYTAGSGVLDVASTGAPFSATQQFRVLIADQSTGAVKAILKVTALNSGTQWAVSSDGLDGNAVSGDLVQLCLTAGSMDQIRADQLLEASGALPSVAKAGDTFLAQDDGVIHRFNGSSFVPCGVYLPNMENPRLQTFGWRNQGSATLTQNASSELITAPANGSVSIKGREVNVPGSTPYTITGIFEPLLQNVSAHSFGLYLGDGTKLVYAGYQAQQFQVLNMNSATSFSSTASTQILYGWFGRPYIVRWVNDGTNIEVWLSGNNVDFTKVYTTAKGAFLGTITVAGFGVDVSNASFGAAIRCISWKVT